MPQDHLLVSLGLGDRGGVGANAVHHTHTYTYTHSHTHVHTHTHTRYDLNAGFGHVINISSIWGKAAPSNHSAYASAKFAI